MDWFGTVRGRIGYSFDRALIYFTGGYAYGRVADQAFLTDGVNSATLVGGTSRSGYVLGGGLEYAVAPAWSLKAEYQYINLGTEILFGAVTPPSGMTVTSSALNDHFSTVRVGLNYKFGWGGPITTRY